MVSVTEVTGLRGVVMSVYLRGWVANGVVWAVFLR